MEGLIEDAKKLLKLTQQTLAGLPLSSLRTTTAPEIVENVMGPAAAGLLLLIGSVSYISCYFLSPFLGIFFNRFGAGFFALVVFPLYILLDIFKCDEEKLPSRQVEMRLAGLSLIQGVFLGYALSDCYLSSQPLMCLTPLVIYLIFNSPLIQGQTLYHLDAASPCIVIAFLINIFAGHAAGLLTWPYAFLSLFYCFFTGLILIHMLNNIVSDNKGAHFHLYHVVLFSGLFLIKGLVFGLFGYSSAQLKAANIPLNIPKSS